MYVLQTVPARTHLERNGRRLARRRCICHVSTASRRSNLDVVDSSPTMVAENPSHLALVLVGSGLVCPALTAFFVESARALTLTISRPRRASCGRPICDSPSQPNTLPLVKVSQPGLSYRTILAWCRLLTERCSNFDTLRLRCQKLASPQSSLRRTTSRAESITNPCPSSSCILPRESHHQISTCFPSALRRCLP